MGLIGRGGKRFSSRLAVVVVSALLAGGVGVPSFAQGLPTGRASAALAENSRARATTSELGSLMKIFAANGIATVASATATAPLVPVSGAVHIRFTEVQVEGMAEQVADHGGATGETLDQADPLPAKDPPVAYLLAAWASKEKTPGALAARKILGAQDWRQADRIVFPSAVLPLFVTDVLRADPPRGRSSTAVDRADVARADVARAGVARAALLPAGLVDAGCSTASNFVQSVLQTVFSALQLTSPSGTGLGSAIGGFFTGIWNGALGLVQKGLGTVITTLTAPVLAAIKSIAGAVAVVAQVASDLTPWSVSVIADPPEITAGSGGAFNAAVNAGVGEYPPAVTDCANALGITLPKLTASGAKGTWALGGATPASPTDVTLDASGTTTLTYTTPAPVTQSSCGSSVPGIYQATAELTVSRPGVENLKDLATSLLTNGLGKAGSVVGPIVASVLDPVLSSVLGQLDNLTQVTGTGTVVIKEQTSGGAPCPTSSSTTPTTLPSRDLPEPGPCSRYLTAADFEGAGGQITVNGAECSYLGMGDSGVSVGDWEVIYFPDEDGAASKLSADVTNNPGKFDFRAVSGIGDEAYFGCNALGCETLARDVNLLVSVGANDTNTETLAAKIVSELGS
jgi:hypothetical protein